MAYTPDDLDRMFKEWEQNIKKKDSKLLDDVKFSTDGKNITMEVDTKKDSIEASRIKQAWEKFNDTMTFAKAGSNIQQGQAVQLFPGNVIIPANSTLKPVKLPSGRIYIPPTKEKCRFCGKEMEECAVGMNEFYRCNTPGCPNNPDRQVEIPIKKIEIPEKKSRSSKVFTWLYSHQQSLVFGIITTVIAWILLIIYLARG